ARVLERRVDEHGRVDFAGLALDRADLDRFVSWVYSVGPNSRPEMFPSRAEVIAYHINAYNALAMYNVIAAGTPRSLSEYGLFRFFYLRRVAVGGEAMSLYRYENEVIRPLGEERAHFALNCMAVSCPRLPRMPFRAATLEAALAAETARFVDEERNVVLDRGRRKVRLSAIFDFYPEDFLARAPSLIGYVNSHRSTPVPIEYDVEFIDYDWTVASQLLPISR
ncbi:MAG: DUF547 domain-containing protein, partial [Betaproteobacteria bacterium]